MIAMSLQELAGVVAGECPSAAAEVRVDSMSTDTRALRPGDLFLALDGESFRGADFSAAAFKAGAVAVVAVMDKSEAESADGPVVRVRDALEALTKLAQFVRSKLSAKVVAITGSVGKTTTKDALASILSDRFKVVASPASFNNRIGVPLTILEADQNTEVLILEIGASLPGEIAALAKLARPDVAVITAVAAAHLEGFGDLATVFAEKISLGVALAEDGLFLVNGDDENLRGEFPRPMQRYGFGQGLEWPGFPAPSGDGQLAFRTSAQGPVIYAALLGEHNLQNLLAAVSVAIYLGMSETEIAQAAANIKAPRWRMELRRVRGAEILLDCYNANPHSMRAALTTLARRPAGARRLAILGDMAELGTDAAVQHLELKDAVAMSKVAKALLVGPLMSAAKSAFANAASNTVFECCKDAAQAALWLQHELRPGDLVLVKGSRAMRLERVVAGISDGEPRKRGTLA
ncbi:MAG: UDP-N-acetylmuramoyl-tripeptide--D-alanyl-D-alanine ligase [Planctomycetota bacterium]